MFRDVFAIIIITYLRIIFTLIYCSFCISLLYSVAYLTTIWRMNLINHIFPFINQCTFL